MYLTFSSVLALQEFAQLSSAVAGPYLAQDKVCSECEDDSIVARETEGGSLRKRVKGPHDSETDASGEDLPRTPAL